VHKSDDPCHGKFLVHAELIAGLGSAVFSASGLEQRQSRNGARQLLRMEPLLLRYADVSAPWERSALVQTFAFFTHGGVQNWAG
jgi:hypothetical protein